MLWMPRATNTKSKQIRLSCAPSIDVSAPIIPHLTTMRFSDVLTTHNLRRRDYVPELARVQAVKEANLAAKKAESMRRMMADLKVDRAQNPAAFANDRWERQDDGDAEGEDDIDVELDDADIIDRSASFLFIRLSAELSLLSFLD